MAYRFSQMLKFIVDHTEYVLLLSKNEFVKSVSPKKIFSRANLEVKTEIVKYDSYDLEKK